LSNAIKYSNGNKVVYLTLDYGRQSLIVCVKDMGIGIPHSEIKSIFKLFYRGSNAHTQKGIGMGMFIVKHCVAIHRGKIEVDSTESVGTTFRVTLPALLGN
jgi:signal transduction histidine kinase